MRREYARLRGPVAIVAGTHDRYVSTRAHSARLHAALPGSRFVRVPGAGHMVHHAAPEAVLDAIGALLAA
jgi:pimeloyl-ACP methyl ester carboxylesterase